MSIVPCSTATTLATVAPAHRPFSRIGDRSCPAFSRAHSNHSAPISCASTTYRIQMAACGADINDHELIAPAS
jgi:hypothetical protein